MNNGSIETELINVKSISFYDVIKRIFDILASSIALLLLSPVMLIVSLLIRKEDKGNAIFTQERIGLNGETFKLYKFRSMINNADEVLEKLLVENEEIREEYRINKKIKNDPRITKIGKFIRKTSIDELPQLINVFKGEMSLIGNRPYLPREKKDMMPYYFDIIKTKPGLTGKWQVSGRNNLTFKNRCKIEAEYSKNHSLKEDFKIFIKTFMVVLKGL